MPAPPAISTALLAAALNAAPSVAADQPDDWWRDAVFYEVFVRSFADSTEGPLAGDGVGDLPGLIERLDELNDGEPGGDDLGVTALWLMPIMQSPSYHGYDISDYNRVDDEYGTNEDFKRLIAECDKRGMKVIVDLVLNHCSWEHPWFVEACDPGSPRHDWFVWRDEKPDWSQNLHMWHKDRYEQTHQYYFGFFWAGMPDLNYDNPLVTLAAYDISRRWLLDMGAAGFRLDAVRHLIERGETVASTPETIAWLEDYRR
ncbi:MAG TPA: alpha-amylase, partial [Phycisphaerales bacterium]|nr:alpha-amylase [Phycisphaerales bacterium]